MSWVMTGEDLRHLHQDLHVHGYVPVVMFLTPSPDTRSWRSFGCGRCVCGMLKMRGKKA